MAPTSSKRTAPKSTVPTAMRSGIRGNSVKELQVLLRDHGMYDRNIDGYYGNYTRNAVYKLQKTLAAAGQPVQPTGHYTQDTVDALNAAGDTLEVASDTSESSPSSPATPRTAESEAGSRPTTTSESSSKKATTSTSSSPTTSGRTSSKASKSSATGKRTSGS